VVDVGGDALWEPLNPGVRVTSGASEAVAKP
jgi:hypothetical protein